MSDEKNGASPDSMIKDFFRELSELGKGLTSEELEAMITSLGKATKEAQGEMKKEKKKREKEAESLKKVRAEREHIEEVTSMELPMDFENMFLDDERADVACESIPDGLILSLTTLGAVNIEYISSVSGATPAEVIEALRGSIFQNPEKWDENFMLGWETRDEYLSGNILRKWRVAREANAKYRGYFDLNLKALEDILPPSVATEDIYVTLGSPWLPADIVDEFIHYMIGRRVKFGEAEKYAVKHNERVGLWEIPMKSRYKYTRYQGICNSKYGTPRMEFLHILENTLNMRTIVVKDRVKKRDPLTGKNTEVEIINESATVLALEKQDLIKRCFDNWIFSDKEREERLKEIYDTRYGAIRRRQFDGSFLTFPGMNPAVTLYPYQKDAVARMIFTPNTLLAHDVGSGKTYEMIAAGMEMRRMGISKKNLYVIPCNLMKQWQDIFLELYPTARILKVDNKNFGPQKRAATLLEVRDGDYDAILMTYSCFDMIPLSGEQCERMLEDSIAELEEAKKSFSTDGSLSKKKKSLTTALEKLKAGIDSKSSTLAFDELGISTLFVDEAHNYKNVPIDTKITSVLGISSTGSEKCRKMMDKVKWVQKDNGGRGVVLATGTPITNSLVDVFVMQQYLQSGELALLGISHFDSWVGMFAEKTTEFEIDVDTSNYRLVTRFANFHNLPELTSILSSIADFHQVDKSAGIPEHDGFKDIVIAPTIEFHEFLHEISDRTEAVRNRDVSRIEDNMLKITVDGRKAALDLRLVDQSAGFTYQSKVARCAEEIFRIYKESTPYLGTQLVFCDTSVPKQGFNLYDELKRLLLSFNIPECEIAYIHDADTEKKRSALFKKVVDGEVRVLIGSTFKLGLGVNVQKRLKALHHLDLPWRPADLIQRQGRILRQGNMNSEVYLIRYITEAGFDAYSWQILETKQRIIAEIFSGMVSERTCADVDGTVLSYAEAKALAIGNPQIKERVEIANKLSRFMILQAEAVEEKRRIGQELKELPARIKKQKELIELCEKDIAYYSENKREYDKDEQKEVREKISLALELGVGNPVEEEILVYQGFRVVIPPFMKKEKPGVRLIREGSYYVEMGTEAGVIRRLDFFLDELERQRDLYKLTLDKFNAHRAALRESMKREVSYADDIEELRKRLEEIDKELGVKK